MATLEQIMTETPVLPNSPEAEKLVLGTLLTESNKLNDVRELLPLDAFYNDTYKDVYRAILSLSDKGERVDVITVMAECPKLGIKIMPAELLQIAQNYAPAGIEEHVAILGEKLKRRKFFEIGALLQANAHAETNDINDVLAEVKDRLDNIFTSSDDNVFT